MSRVFHRRSFRAGAVTGTRRGQTVAGALRHQSLLEFGDGAEDLEEHTTHGGGGVDALVHDHQVHTAWERCQGNRHQ